MRRRKGCIFVAVLFIISIVSCAGDVATAFPPKSQDKFKMKEYPRTEPKGVKIRKLCINNVLYYVTPPGGMALAVTTEGEIITCGKYEA